MDRKEFGKCVFKTIKGRKFDSVIHRRLEMCIQAKVCSKKFPDRESAKKNCFEKHPDWKQIVEQK